MPARQTRKAYKELTLQQLRSFRETVRLGSFKAAAASLGLAHPTVWEQVHALERHLQVRLIQPHGRGCRVTDDGRRLAEMAAPVVAGADALARSFHQARTAARPRLTVATTQRTLVEDLPGVIVEFERRHPDVQLCLKEVSTRQVLAAVEAGQADLGLSAEWDASAPASGLIFQPAYELEHFLITPADHPLARQKRVTPRDLAGYPLVNAPDSIPDAGVTATLARLGIFQTTPRRIEAYYTAVICRYVELGFGIGLVVGLPAGPRPPQLHARSMSRYFGRTVVNLIRTRGVPASWYATAFADLIQSQLGSPPRSSPPRQQGRKDHRPQGRKPPRSRGA